MTKFIDLPMELILKDLGECLMENVLNDLEFLIEQTKEGSISESELTKRAIPIVLQMSRLIGNNTQMKKQSQEQELKMVELEVQNENYRWLNSMYLSFINEQCLSDELDNFINQQVKVIETSIQ